MREFVFLALAVALPVALVVGLVKAEVMGHYLGLFVWVVLTVLITFALTGINVMPDKGGSTEAVGIHILTVFGIAFGSNTLLALLVGFFVGLVGGGLAKRNQ
jgi:hypothetical protein